MRSIMCRNKSIFVALALMAIIALTKVSASVFLPSGCKSNGGISAFGMSRSSSYHISNQYYKQSMKEEENRRKMISRMVRRNVNPTTGSAMAIPGYGVVEQVFVGGFSTFLSIYNLVITARILLSWFPQAQGVAVLQPVYAITDPYLNLFRGLIPPIFGLDLSPLLAFFLLNVLTNVTAAIGADITADEQKKLQQLYSPFTVKQCKTPQPLSIPSNKVVLPTLTLGQI